MRFVVVLMRSIVANEMITVEIAYAKLNEQALITVQTQCGISAKDAIMQSGIIHNFPEITLDTTPIGIFGKVIPWDHILKSGDRVEIYRPLIADPKEQRKRKAAATAKAQNRA